MPPDLTPEPAFALDVRIGAVPPPSFLRSAAPAAILLAASCAGAAGNGAEAPFPDARDEAVRQRWLAAPPEARGRVDAVLDRIRDRKGPPLRFTLPPDLRSDVWALAREGLPALDGIAVRRIRASLAADRKDFAWDELESIVLREARILTACRMALAGGAAPEGTPEVLLPQNPVTGEKQAPNGPPTEAHAKEAQDLLDRIALRDVLPEVATRLLKSPGARWVLEEAARGPESPRSQAAASLLPALCSTEFLRVAAEGISDEDENAETATPEKFPLLYYPGALVPHKPSYLTQRRCYLRDLAFGSGASVAVPALDERLPLPARRRVALALASAGIAEASGPIKKWLSETSPKEDFALWMELSLHLWVLGDPAGAESLKRRYEAGFEERRKNPFAADLQAIPFLIERLEEAEPAEVDAIAAALEARARRKEEAAPQDGETRPQALARAWRSWWASHRPSFDVGDDQLAILRNWLEMVDPSFRPDRQRAEGP